MATSPASAVTVCSKCGEPLNAKDECIACLLRTGLEESSTFDAKSSDSLVFGDFEVARREDGSHWELGRGAFAVTYLAVDKVLRRKVALKVIDVPAAARGSLTVRERFLREARAAAVLRHPNIAAIYQFGASPNGNRCFYAMELVPGETLETRVRRDGPLNAKLVLEIAIQISRALMAAAAHSLIHRDLKPANIMLTSGDAETAELEVKVIDFGLAKAIADAGEKMDLTHGGFVGTPNFASPEQFETSPVDARSDIYSLGATLWFALTGKTPFSGRDIDEIRRAHKSEVLPIEQLKAARVPSRLRHLLKSMLAIESAARPGVRDLGAELQRCSAHANRKNLRRRRIALAVSLFLIFGVSVFFVFPSLRTLLRPEAIADNSSANPPGTERSIAVLPFENASQEQNTEYLSEGISEALINSLSELPQLRVIARPTAFRYNRKDVDPRQVGRELGVAAVLTGKVRQMKDTLNVQVDLMDPVTGAQIWGAGYDRKISDLVAVKQAIAQEVAVKLKLKLSTEQQRRLVKRDSTNAEAYQFYLRGRYFWNKRTSDGIKHAIEQFQQSIEHDPNFALGYVGLADSYTGLTFYNFAAPHEAMPKAKESAIRALALDDTLAEAHATLGHILINYDWAPSESEKEFKRSIELNPEYATAHQWYAIHYLTATGRLEEAVQEMKKALELEPASLVMNTFMGATLCYAGRYNEAIDQCRKTIEMDPNFGVAHWHLGLAYEQKQLLDAATEEFKKAISLSGGSPLMKAALGRAYAKSQKKHEAHEILDELNELATRQYASAYEIATIYVALGNNEEAFQMLTKAYAEHSFHLVNLNVSPQFKSVRSDPRFQDLVQRIGLSKSASNPVAAEKSIAVLPFENLSDDKANAYFAEGIHDEILTRLSKIADLKVISRTSTQHYKSAPDNLAEIAKQLGVAHIVEGRVQKSGDAVRVNVQLIKAANDGHLWAETYDRKLVDTFAIETEIAKAVAEKLQAKITGREENVISKQSTENSEAHQLYLKGRYFWNKRTADGLNTSINYFNQAIEKDPAYAPAYAGLADAYSVLPNYSETPGNKAYAKAEAAAERALKLNDSLAEAHISLANVRLWHRWGNGAEPEFKRGLELNPNYSTGHQWYSIYLSVIGRNENAISEMEKAKELDPFSIIINTEVGCPYLYSKRYEQAIEYFRKAIEMDPAFPFAHFALAEALDQQGQYKEALEEHDKAAELARADRAFDLGGGDAPRAWYALTGQLQNTYAALGGVNYWQHRLEAAKQSYEKGTTTAMAVAEIQGILGENEQALGWLEKAYRESDDFLVFINIRPQFENLHSDERYQWLVQKVFHTLPP